MSASQVGFMNKLLDLSCMYSLGWQIIYKLPYQFLVLRLRAYNACVTAYIRDKRDTIVLRSGGLLRWSMRFCFVLVFFWVIIYKWIRKNVFIFKSEKQNQFGNCFFFFSSNNRLQYPEHLQSLKIVEAMFLDLLR